MSEPRSLPEIARQAARSMKTYHDLDQVADAVAVAVLQEVHTRILASVSPSLNTAPAMTMLAMVGTVLADLQADFSPSTPEATSTEIYPDGTVRQRWELEPGAGDLNQGEGPA